MSAASAGYGWFYGHAATNTISSTAYATDVPPATNRDAEAARSSAAGERGNGHAAWYTTTRYAAAATRYGDDSTVNGHAAATSTWRFNGHAGSACESRSGGFGTSRRRGTRSGSSVSDRPGGSAKRDSEEAGARSAVCEVPQTVRLEGSTGHCESCRKVNNGHADEWQQ